MYAGTGGANTKWGAHILNGGPCTTAPHRGGGPVSSTAVTVVQYSCKFP